MIADLHAVSGDDPGGLPLAAWNQVVDHIKACWPYSRPWTVETQQAFYDALCRFTHEELIGAASRLAVSVTRRHSRDWRERPSLAELREAACAERAGLERLREETRERLAVLSNPFRGWHKAELPFPDENAGPFTRLAYAISIGEVPPFDPVARDRFLAAYGL